MQRVLCEKFLKAFLSLFLFFGKNLRQLAYRFSHVDLVFSTLLKIFDHFQFAGHITFTLYFYTGKETIIQIEYKLQNSRIKFANNWTISL